MSHRVRSSASHWWGSATLGFELAAGAVLPLLLVILSMYWPISTRVSIELVTARIGFVLRATRQTLQPLRFSALTFERCAYISFEGITFSSARGQIPAPFDRLDCSDPDSKIRIEATAIGGAPVGSMQAITFERDTDVSIGISGDHVPIMTMEISGQILDIDVALERDVDLVTELVGAHNYSSAVDSGLQRYRGTLQSAPRQVLHLRSTDRGGVLVLALPDRTLPQMLEDVSRIPVASVRFDREALSGVATSALIENAILTYPDYPQRGQSVISRDDALVIERMREAQIRGLRIASASSGETNTKTLGLELSLDGVIESGEVGAGDSSVPGAALGRWRDLRLTLFDRLTQGRWKTIGVVFGWVVALLWAVKRRAESQ